MIFLGHQTDSSHNSLKSKGGKTNKLKRQKKQARILQSSVKGPEVQHCIWGSGHCVCYVGAAQVAHLAMSHLHSLDL